MTALTAKGASFVWGKEQQQAFEAAKDALCVDGVLAHVSEDSMLVLRTDASEKGCGGVLMSRETGDDRPVSFFSKKFSSAHSRWPTVEQELYAIIFCLTQRSYASVFKARPVLDHRNLVFLHKMADSNRRLPTAVEADADGLRGGGDAHS